MSVVFVEFVAHISGVKEIIVRSVLNKKKFRDPWFLDDYTVNAYEGCPMNCLYCYVRGSKFGENMADSISVKINAPGILEKQLAARAKKQQYGFVVMSSATDPYIETDKIYGMSHRFLELFNKYRFPVHIITKSNAVLNDMDILKEIEQRAILPKDLQMPGVIISFSLSSLDENLYQRIESGAPPPERRLEAMEQLSRQGFLTGINAMPLLPGLSDSEIHIEEIVKRAKQAGAHYFLGAGLSLFGNENGSSKMMMLKFIQMYYPQLYELYVTNYRDKSTPGSDYNSMLSDIIKKICERYEIRNSIRNT